MAAPKPPIGEGIDLHPMLWPISSRCVTPCHVTPSRCDRDIGVTGVRSPCGQNPDGCVTKPSTNPAITQAEPSNNPVGTQPKPSGYPVGFENADFLSIVEEGT